jgi:hypothetical protein
MNRVRRAEIERNLFLLVHALQQYWRRLKLPHVAFGRVTNHRANPLTVRTLALQSAKIASTPPILRMNGTPWSTSEFSVLRTLTTVNCELKTEI